jgi:hypothetical protein
VRAIVTLVVGKAYQNNFARYCLPNWNDYAKRHGMALVIHEELLDHSERARLRSVAWQKCLAVCHETSRKFEQVVWIDSDIIINSSNAPNIFEGVCLDEVGAVPDFAYPSVEGYRARLMYFFRQWDALGIPYVKNLTPQEFMTTWGLPPLEFVVQTGVLVMNPEAHKTTVMRTYNEYEDKGASSWNYEMRPLSYEIVTNLPVKWLDLRFNVLTLFGVKDDELKFFQSRPSLLERGLQKVFGAEHVLTIPRHKRLVEIHERLLNESYFVHFAGRQDDMKFANKDLAAGRR